MLEVAVLPQDCRTVGAVLRVATNEQTETAATVTSAFDYMDKDRNR